MLILSAMAAPYTPSSDSIVGTWLTNEKDSKVKIYKYKGKYYGRVSWLEAPNDKNGQPIKDIYNKNTQLRSREIVGIPILTNFDYESGKWVNGKIYNPRDGGTYTAKLEMSSNNMLKVTGYWGIFSQSGIWIRSN